MKHTDNVENVKIRVFTAFSGYDSQCLALDRLRDSFPGRFDYDLVGWSEIDDAAIRAHDILFPQFAARNYGDISKVDWNDVPDFDLLTYSSPCFVAGTKVITFSGEKNIEDIVPGDFVLTHKCRWRIVTKTYASLYVGPLCKVDPSGFASVVCTPNHPFFSVKDGEECWIEAGSLDVKRDRITYAGRNGCDGYRLFHEIVLSIVRTDSYGTACVVYNIEVEDDHSYTANGFVVHNCTDISKAGRQDGLSEGSGTRSSLLWECRRCIEAKRPKYLLFENVTALLSDKFMPQFEKWMSVLRSLGYVNFYQVLNAKDYGIPQNRERVFMVSVRQDDEDVISYNFPNPLPRTAAAEDFFETDVGDEYYVDQERVDEWCADNEDRIAYYIATRNGISPENVKIS